MTCRIRASGAERPRLSATVSGKADSDGDETASPRCGAHYIYRRLLEKIALNSIRVTDASTDRSEKVAILGKGILKRWFDAASMHPDTTHPNPAHSPTVRIAGVDWLGLRCCALAEYGFRVTLFEAALFGGRASCIKSGRRNCDNCQHVLFGAAQSAGVLSADWGRRISLYETMTFVDGRAQFGSGAVVLRLSAYDAVFLVSFLDASTSWRSRVPWRLIRRQPGHGRIVLDWLHRQTKPQCDRTLLEASARPSPGAGLGAGEGF